jgi:HD-GYP domain-containing protein (c-di-GMP phosphodiesterase class II)
VFSVVPDADKASETPATAAPVETRRPRRPDPLIRVAARLNAALDLPAVLTAVAEEAAAATDARTVAVFLNDRGRDEMVIAGSYGLPERIRNLWPTLTPGSFDDLFGGSRVLVVPDIEQDNEVVDRAVYSALGIVGFAMVRMARNGELVGVIAVLSLDAPREFDDEELGLLRGIADQATQAVRNAWLLNRADRRLRLTQALRNIDIAIAGSMDLRVTLSVILDEVARQLNVDACDVLLLDRRTQLLTFAAGRGFRTTRIEQSRKQLGEGPPGRAARERRAIGVIDLQDQTSQLARSTMIAGEDFQSYYALPLIAKGHVKGVLEIFQRGPLLPDADWLEFAEALAGQAAIALDNATLFEEMQRLNTSLMMAYDNTLEGWSRALDLRDRETEGHTQRVTELTVRLARALSYTTDELTHVRRGAILHDIGKMGIPDSILLKPGPLTEDEWAVMRRHPVLAHELLSPIPYLRPALDIPYCHHERWDGTGYPRGLRGDQIPLAARIFAVADVWDALRSDRPYRNAWSATQTRDYIRSLAGSHFDPNVVDLFERVYEA